MIVLCHTYTKPPLISARSTVLGKVVEKCPIYLCKALPLGRNVPARCAKNCRTHTPKRLANGSTLRKLILFRRVAVI